MMNALRTGLVSMGLIAALALAGCGGGSEGGGAKPVTGGGGGKSSAKRSAFPKDKATASVTGRVKFDGSPEEYKKKIKIQGDPFCEKCYNAEAPPAKEEVVIGADGALKNVVVYIKEADQWDFAAPTTPVAVAQRHCVYVPHVLGVMAGQPVEISSEDDTTHNVHFVGKENPEFNFTQKKGQKDTKTFARAEFALFKCDVHSWMGAHVGIFYHPFFCVTGEDGKVSFPEKLPAGEYTVVAWQELMGAQEQKITLTDGGAQEVNFSFKLAK